MLESGTRPQLTDIVITRQTYVSTNGWHWCMTIPHSSLDKGKYPCVRFGGAYSKVPDLLYDDKNFPPSQHEIEQWMRSHNVEPKKSDPPLWNQSQQSIHSEYYD